MTYDNREGPDEVGRALPTYEAELGTRISLVIDLYDLKADAARVADVTPEMLNRYVRGQHKIPFTNAARLASAKGVSLDWLWSGEGPMLLRDRVHDSPPAAVESFDLALMGNLVSGLMAFLQRESLDLDPEYIGRAVTLLYMLMERERRDTTPEDRPDLWVEGHPVDIANDKILAETVRLALGRLRR
ncbi:MAG TPA: helix-turn-helix transcriptional regulator [Azospirillum sp.]|nr:helix-turn-helix transcriptional regulator [Azospirillum sp.]